MSDQILSLADAYPPVTHDDWLGAVERVLGGRSIDRIRTRLADGIVVEPLYTAEDTANAGEWPGQGDRRRGGRPAGSTGGWDVRQAHTVAGDPSVTNAAILDDLVRGVTSIELDTYGLDAVTLDRVLDGVHLDLAPIGLVGLDDGIGAARLLLDLADSRSVSHSELVADLGCDPIGATARRGGLATPVDEAISAVAALAAEVAADRPGVRTVRVDGGHYAAAGATPATELGVIVASGVAWLRALTAAGLDIEAAAGQVQLVVTVGTDQFGDIAKIRALRILWSRVLDASGAGDHDVGVQASMARSVVTAYDPWVNILRGTIACFAGAVAGADTVLVAPFDSAVGEPDKLGMRIARNTQLVLMEESNLHRVIDAAGGSWYLESLTDAFADAAWFCFQDIESHGGIIATLRSGSLQDRIEASWEGIARSVATRRRAVVGVSEFPDLGAQLLVRPPRSAELRLVASPEVRPLRPHRLAEDFEALRDVAAAASPQPRVFLANLGPPTIHNARAGWATNAFGAGGIAAVATAGFEDDESLVVGYLASGCRIAVLCSSDAVYGERAPAAAAALKAAGVERLYLAGDPGQRRTAEEAAGVDEFVHVGVDLVEVARRVHAVLGITPVTDAPAANP